MTPADKRAARIAQAKHRGTKRSHVTALEDALIVLAWEAELLSEGQVSWMLDMDRVSLRIKRETLLDDAMKLANAMTAARPDPLLSDDREIAKAMQEVGRRIGH